MRFHAPLQLGVLLGLSFVHVEAFWRMVCGTIQTGRIDPIISPGGISGHCHTIAGPINLNTTSTYASLQSAYCTSCSIQSDKSGYWTPQLYYRHRNGSFEYVPHDGTVVYYLGRGVNRTNIVPFPPGFRVLAGDSGARAYDPNTLTYSGNSNYAGRPLSDRVSFACLDSEPMPEQPWLFRTNCSSGLRAQIHFPSCWDGVNLYKSDQSHVAYLSDIDNGICPPTHPNLFIHIFFEVIYAVNNINQTDGGMFVFANGDTTGYGFHGDFLNGWDTQVLSNAITQCANTDSGSIADCAPLAASQDAYFNINCPEQPPLVNETVQGLLKALPGCNPPTGGPVRASQNICPVQPRLNYVANTDNFTRFIAKPGDKLANWTYLGCVNDNSNIRPVAGISYTSTTSMTIESCTAYCHANLYPLAALEYSSQCYCGTQLASSSSIQSPLVCSTYSYMVCSGNGLEYCGGPYLMQLWSDNAYAGPIIMGTPTVGVTNLTLPSGVATYAGCHTEAVNSRALTGTTYSNSTGMTLESCAAFCAKSKYLYFGTEYGSECYCGNSISTALLAEGNCSMQCSGNKGETCGAGSKLSVWSLPVANAPIFSGSGTATATVSAPPVSTSVVGALFFGCWSETTPVRAIAPGFYTNNSMTINLCAAYAQQLNLPVFGLEYASQCLVGKTLGASSATSTKCTMGCNGNAQQICGGNNAISVYNNTAYVPPVNPNPVNVPGQSVQYAYLGCYSEPGGARALAGPNPITVTSTTLTVEACAALCYSKGYPYMGVENGNECFCNSVGVTNGAQLSPGGDADCVTTCVGNAIENCGAPSKLNVYQKIGSGRIGSSRVGNN